MNTPEMESANSRFAYYGDEETGEGGVRAASSAQNNASSRGNATPRYVGGAPGPEERLLDISELARTVGMHYTHHFNLPAGKAEEFEAVAPITGEMTLTNTGPILLLRGHAETILGMECGRCLAPTQQPVEVELEEEFDLLAKSNAFHQEEVLAVDEDTPAAVIENNVLNLGELLRQNLLLAAPLQPLCREECPGLPYGNGDFDAAAGDAAAAEADKADNPLRRLAEMLEAKRQSSE